MKKNRGIQKLTILVLLGFFTFSNTIPYQQFIQKNKRLEIRVESQKSLYRAGVFLPYILE
ncbi:PhrA family quorum-sensing system peptide [Streptococcus suis]|uniref:PhrA family quorum-sensing system peptide n=1 Tax=Streptococcus suis TaxID=1307 RepID=UPI0014791A2E